MSKIDAIAVEASVNMLRGVPWGPSRDTLLADAARFNREASFERGWDNYSTAARLNWQADLYQLAAEARFPRDGDEMVGRIRKRVTFRLSQIVRSVPMDRDVGELTRTIELAVDAAIPSLSGEDVKAISDELEEAGLLSDSDCRPSDSDEAAPPLHA